MGPLPQNRDGLVMDSSTKKQPKVQVQCEQWVTKPAQSLSFIESRIHLHVEI